MDSLGTITHKGYQWFKAQGWTVYDFQREAWDYYAKGYSGLVNAPTGSGKTYSLFVPAIVNSNHHKGLKIIWITPIRALSKEISNAAQRATQAMGYDWRIETRTGDTDTKTRQVQWKNPPDMLITTPETIHVMMTNNGYTSYFKDLEAVIVDEWHELLGSKRGVQVELALSRLKTITNNKLKIWGISATIGNLEEALDVLVGVNTSTPKIMVRASTKKQVVIKTILPEKVETLPWAGHLGINLVKEVASTIHSYGSTLIFTNTRAQCEIWYQKLLEIDDSLAGIMAMHHGSISRELRDWVEDALYDGKLKAVICTSSLELGVDFRPVENIIQVGSPKGVARFLQRAGRSGHAPGQVSQIFFLPTHALELIEVSALRTAVDLGKVEDRTPYIRSFDVLMQYLMTLAVSEGFHPKQIYEEIKTTFCFSSLSEQEWSEMLSQLLYGAQSLQAYDEYHKLSVIDGIYQVTNKGIALRHRLSIGTIVSDAMIQVKYLNGKYLGSIEEWFVTGLTPGDVFWFAGRALELIRFKDMVAQVRDSKAKKGKIPAYMGGRLQLSSQLSKGLQQKIDDYLVGKIECVEMQAISELFEVQKVRSILPSSKELLIEIFESKEGWHITMYPFEGRSVHEGMAALLGNRLSSMLPLSFSISMNDYGFELLTDAYFDFESYITPALFATKNLLADIQASINAVELSKRKFRDVAVISGLVFTGYPNNFKKEKHLQSSSSLIFGVFQDYEPDNLLYRQTYEEVMSVELEEARLRTALSRIQNQKLVFSYPQKPTPFAFPLIVDRLRERMSSEQLEDRIRKMMLE
jgi:ATP-dependent helicase Lhr and Lhr-like helicase